IALEQRDRVAGVVELRRRGHARRPGPGHRDRATGAEGRRLGLDPALVPRLVGDGLLDLLDRHGVVVDVEHARRLTGRGADAADELREVVRGLGDPLRVAPAAAVDGVVPVGDQVPERTAGVTERDAAVHAARALLLQLGFRQWELVLDEVLYPLGDRPLRAVHPVDLEEAANLTHCSAAPPPWPPPR